jgi:hypothetical protein
MRRNEAIDMAVFTRILERLRAMHDKEQLDAMFGIAPRAEATS